MKHMSTADNRLSRQLFATIVNEEVTQSNECYLLKMNKVPSKPTGFISGSKNRLKYEKQRQTERTYFNNKQINRDAENKYKVKRSADPIMDTFKPFTFDGFVSLSNEKPNIPIKRLRDTGASQTLILTKTLPFSESSHSDANVLIRGINSKDYRSNLVTGDVSLGIIEFLPFEEIHLFLRNDLAGDKVKARLIEEDWLG